MQLNHWVVIYPKINWYSYNILGKPHGNEKSKTPNRHAKDKEKQIKAYHYGKPLYHKKR